MPTTGEEGSSGQSGGEAAKEIKKSPPTKKRPAIKKPSASQVAGQQLAEATQRQPPAQPGDLAKRVEEHLTSPSDTKEDQQLSDEETPDQQRQQRAQQLRQEYPQLVARALEYPKDSQEQTEAMWRLLTQYAIDHPNPEAETEVIVASYGVSAPTFINGMEQLSGIFRAEAAREKGEEVEPLIPRPNILILGAQTPGAVVDVAHFTQPFGVGPESITVADISPVALALATTAEPHMQAAQLDWTSKESAAQLPPFDIALANRIVDFTTSPTETPLDAAKKYEETGQILENVAQNMSSEGGIVLVINSSYNLDSDQHKEQIRLLAEALSKHGLFIANAGSVIEFDKMPTHEEMAQKSTFTARDDENHSINMVAYGHGFSLVVKKMPVKADS